MLRNIFKRKKKEVIFLLSRKGNTAEAEEMILSIIFSTVVTLIGIDLGWSQRLYTYNDGFCARVSKSVLFLGATGVLNHFSVTQVYN